VLLPALAASARALGLPGRRVLVACSGGVDSTVLLCGLCALAPELDRAEQRIEGYDGLPRADVTLKEAAHGMRPPHVRADFAQHARLRFGQLESERGEKRFDQAIIAAAGQRF